MKDKYISVLAFPSHGSMGEVIEQGMTLRDYFAAKAMQGMMAYDPIKFIIDNNTSMAKSISINAYYIADAMLEARKD